MTELSAEKKVLWEVNRKEELMEEKTRSKEKQIGLSLP